MPFYAICKLIRRYFIPAIGCGLIVLLLYSFFATQYLPKTNPKFELAVRRDWRNDIKAMDTPLPDPFDQNGVFQSMHSDKQNEIPDSDGTIDWHDWDMIRRESMRKGPGEQGKGVEILPEEQAAAKVIHAQNGFSGYASDKMSLARSVGDRRHPQCHKLRYLAKLPTVSIVIPFFEEHNSTLLRTAISCLNRAAPQLIKEVIMVDDGSTHKPFLKEPLVALVNRMFPDGNVKILRNAQREGLIRTRLVGARAATGDVLIFLDSHVECSANWLPPLIDPIARDYKTVTCPFIDVLDMNNFEFRPQDEGGRGAWAWNFDYKRLPRLKEDDQHPWLPFDSPVMAGGLFAISRKWFWELGGYDEGLYVWGGEQYELSFKIWMCGGRMIDVPCSRIAHAYRSGFPYHDTSHPNSLAINYKRIAEVWLDDYKDALYYRRPNLRSLDPGDLTKQKAVREKLQCKSFDWFLNKVAYDQKARYPTKDPQIALQGPISSHADSQRCLSFANEVSMEQCSDTISEQKIAYTFKGEIRQGTNCLESGSFARKYRCHGYYKNQKFLIRWSAAGVDKNPVQVESGIYSNQCLNAIANKVNFVPCDKNQMTQLWNFKVLNYASATKQWQDWGILAIADAV